MSYQAASILPVDDPRRPLLRRAVFATLWAVSCFVVLAATKLVHPIFDHAPWFNDPYDVVISFTMFFVPLIAACLLVQVSLCRRSEPLSMRRVAAILRGCRIVIGAAVAEIVTDWAAVALRANGPQWTGFQTGVEVTLLALVTVATVRASVALRGAPRMPSVTPVADEEVPDWLSDAVAVAKRESHWFGPICDLSVGVLDWTDRTVVPRARRHPAIAAAIASAAFAVIVLGWQAYREDYFLSMTVIVIGLGFCGMFVFLMAAGSYFGLVRSTRQSCGLERRAIDASVIGCAAVIVALAFRTSIWPSLGSGSSIAEPAQFAALESAAFLMTFALVLAVETLMRSHQQVAS